MGVIDIRSSTNRRLVNAYGSRRGCIRSYWYRLLYFTRFYQAYRRIDWSSVERLVFVCKGNICRSAFAEAVAKSEGVDAVSCGLDTIEAAPANVDAIKTAGKMGFNLDGHRTTPITLLTINENDLFIAMEPWQAEYIKAHFHDTNTCTLLGLWGEPVRPYIHDPYSSTIEYFETCFKYIEKTVYEISSKIKAEKS
ncbi:MAG: phosphotyrosine protein phosphatase [Gammaproteobacteria bacterium]|nr:phosphotyrosine protein phosphatase [Gammaproteobacteria bacterium]